MRDIGVGTLALGLKTFSTALITDDGAPYFEASVDSDGYLP
jgi:hypothetical protein